MSRQANIMNVKSFILVSGANGGSLRGQCFEDLAHTFVAKGLLTSIRALSEEGRLVLPKSSATHAFLPSSEHLSDLAKREGEYLYPSIPNFESVDSFARVKDTLFMFQITVSASHPVKANGLEKVIKQFGEGCTTSNLIFVVPKGTEDTFRTQGYVT